MLKRFLSKVAGGGTLTRREAAGAMSIIMDGAADDAQIAALCMAMRVRGETADEIAGCAQALRGRAERMVIPARVSSRLVDTCGTGGDSLGTLNVSTIAALVTAGAGVPVAKHGNRAISSRCGSADLVEALGLPVDLSPAQAADCLQATGIAFLFAPRFHPALRHAGSARRSLGLRTIFNLIGPLCNPARARRQVAGVYDAGRLRVMAEVLRALGSDRVMLVHGSDGMDELTVTGSSRIVELRSGRISAKEVSPEEAGLRRWPAAALRGGTVEKNVAKALHVLGGGPGAARDIVVFNAAAALVVAGVARTLREGAHIAGRSIDTGAAGERLESLREFAGKLRSAAATTKDLEAGV